MSSTDVLGALSNQAKTLWAKTGTGEDRLSWEPLYIHLFDSAEIAKLVWRDYLADSVKNTISDSLSLSEEDAQSFVAWITAVHDIGKATPTFQNNRFQRDLWEKDLVAGFSNINPAKRWSHAFLGQEILRRWLDNQWNCSKEAETIISIVGGHHGIYPSAQTMKQITTFKSEVLGDAIWQSAQEELLNAVYEVYLNPQLAKRLFNAAITPALEVLLTAIVIMADWISSNTELFPLITSIDSLSVMRQRAAMAWQYLGLPKAYQFAKEDIEASRLFHNRFPSLPANAKLNSVQLATLSAAMGMKTPGLMIIEAPMGCGKTEASLLGAEILAQKFGQSGIAYLLPTQATSNAMFDRVEQWMDCLLHDQNAQEPQDLHLLHSKASLDERFRALPRWKPGTMGDETSASQPSEEMLVAHQWFGGRKRGLLANAVVGTVDQLLMMALKAKHVQLRHLGLAGKVVIVDEVHAYDAYMSTYLQQALYFLGTYHVPVILLSATLPPERKESLIKAYAGRPTSNSSRISNHQNAEKPSHPYPAVTVSWDRSTEPQVFPCENTGASKAIAVEWLNDDDETLVSLLQENMESGGCVCIIRDTVARAQHTYDLLKERLSVPLVLAHSRFMAIDRAKKDSELLELLGKNSTNRPQSFVVVGTQVIEQSLDIDFDLMVSDIAPIDLLLQRMGRLHRHHRGVDENERPPKLRTPKLFVTGVEDWNDELPQFAKGVSQKDGKGVYEPALLYKTILVLKHELELNGMVHLPDDIAKLVDTVYGSLSDLSLVPDAWKSVYKENVDQFCADQRASTQNAKHWRLGTFGRRGSQGLTGWMDRLLELPGDDGGRQAVRDGSIGAEIVLLQRKDGVLSLLPWVAKEKELDTQLLNKGEEPIEEVCRVAASCTVALPPWLCRESFLLDLEKVSKAWEVDRSPWLQGCLVLELDKDGCIEVPLTEKEDAINNSSKQKVKLSYSKDYGLKV